MRAEPILAIFETYQNIEYIANARRVADELLKGAITALGEKATDKNSKERNRSTALSYAKDLVVADKITLKKMINQAQKNYDFITGKTEGQEESKE